MSSNQNFHNITRNRVHAKDFAQSAEPTPRPAVIAILIIIFCIAGMVK